MVYCSEDDEVRCDIDDEIVDDETSFEDQAPSDYRLKNVTKSLREVLKDTSMQKHYVCPDPENFIRSFVDDAEYDYSGFHGVEVRIEKFKKILKIYQENSKDSFYYAVFYGSFLKLGNTKDQFVKDREKLKSVLSESFLERLEEKREALYLDLNLNTFQGQCQEIMTF